jgi:hypothetical protein
MFLIVNLETIFHTEFVGICMICLHSKFPCLLQWLIAIKPKAKYRFHAAIIFVYIVHNKKKTKERETQHKLHISQRSVTIHYFRIVY